MKKLILFLFLSTSLFCFGQGKSALKDIQSIKFYGVDYSQVKIFGADESPAQFKDAFRRINELFITEAKKYNVGKQLKKEVTEISLDAVNQVNENIDLTELMTAKREYTLSKEQIKAAINALPIQKTPGVGMVFIAQFLDKSNNRGTYEVVFFNTETKEIIEEWITDGKARGFGLRNYWARGNFTVDMDWKNNVLNKAIIRSNIGGTFRIRSYVPLKGKGLKQVNGKECSNRLFATTPIKQPLVAKGVSAQSPKLQKVYEYDIETKPGKTYIVNTIEGKQ